MLLTIMVLPEKAVGQASVGTTMWAENFSGYSSSISGDVTNSHTGTTVYGSNTITYSLANGTSTTQLYTSGTGYAGGSLPELLVSKGGGKWTIDNIPTGSATELTLTYKTNNSNNSISCTTTGVTVTEVTNKSTRTFTIEPNGAEKITLVVTNSAGSNTRVDDFSLVVKTAGGSTPSLSVSPSSIAFGTKVVGSSTAESFTVTYANLTPNATVSLAGTSTTSCTIDPTSFSVDASGAGSQTVTMTYAPQAAGSLNGSITVAEAADNVNASVTVTGTAKVAHNITINPSIVNGNVTSNKSTAIEGETVTLTVTPNTNYTLSSLTVVGSGDEITVTNNQFTMPDEAVTVSATFVDYHAYVINFESELSSYVDWEFSGLSRNNNSSEAHGGSYYLINYANSAATTTGTITTKNKIAKPGTLKFYVKSISVP